MILTIFNRIKNNEKGGIEFIESSVVFPIVMSFLFLLLFFSINFFIKIIYFENTYYESRKILNQKDDIDYLNKEIDDKNKNYGSKNLLQLKSDRKILKNTGIIKTVSDAYSLDTLYLSSEKIFPDDVGRKIKFIKYVFTDIKNSKTFGTIEEIFIVIKNSEDKIIKNTK